MSTSMPELPELQDTTDNTITPMIVKPCTTCGLETADSTDVLFYIPCDDHSGQGELRWHEACYIADPWIMISYTTLSGDLYKYMRPVSVIQQIFSEFSEGRPGFMIESHALRYFHSSMLKTVEVWRHDLQGKEVEEI